MFTRKYLFFFVATLVLVGLASTAFALEVEYPTIPGWGNQITPESGLPAVIRYIFLFLVVSAGGVGVLSMVIGGFQILLNFGKPEAISGAKKRIFDAAIGTILLVSSVVILRTINPELVTPTSPAASNAFPGAHIKTLVPQSESNPTGINFRPAPPSIGDIGKFFADDEGSPQLVYYCVPPGPTLLVFEYGQVGFVRGSQNFTTELPCDGQEHSMPITGGSIRRTYKGTGVYFFNQAGCKGVAACYGTSATCALTTDGKIPSFDLTTADQAVRSILIVDGSGTDKKHAVVLRKTADATSECTLPLANKFQGPGCIDIPLDSRGKDFNPLYAQIIRPNEDYESAGGGVTLYSSNLRKVLPPEVIGEWFSSVTSPDQILLNEFDIYTDKTPEEVKAKKECEEDDRDRICLRKVERSGDYYTILYARDSESGQESCKIFRNDIENLALLSQESNFLQYTTSEIWHMEIIPAVNK